MAWVPPSLKAMEKLPRIEVDGDNRIQAYLDWFDENDTIARTIPPLYPDFTVRFFRTYYDPARDREPVRHEYIECVHYSEDLTSMDICHIIDGKKVLNTHSDYVKFDGKTVTGSVSVPQSTRYDADWLKREGIAAIYSVLSVQAYILYHRPEVTPVFLDGPPAGRKSPAKPSVKKRERVISDAVRRFIRLTATDNPPKQRNYRAIQWTVRGHYRRLRRKDGEERMVYIHPHIAARGGKGKKKSGTADIIMKGPKKKEGE